MEGDACTSSTESLFAAKIMPQPCLLSDKPEELKPQPVFLAFLSAEHQLPKSKQTDLLPDKRQGGLLPVQGSAQDRLKVSK